MTTATTTDNIAKAGGKTAVITLVKGDITDLDVEAFVFYAQDDLELGAGFGNAVSARGGPSIKTELQAIGRVPPQGAVVTEAGNLKARYIVHANGPKFQEPDTENKLKRTVLNALAAAEERGLRTIAFPGMGTGFYGVPKPLAARVMRACFDEHLANGSKLKSIVVCLLETRELEAFQNEFNLNTGSNTR